MPKKVERFFYQNPWRFSSLKNIVEKNVFAIIGNKKGTNTVQNEKIWSEMAKTITK